MPEITESIYAPELEGGEWLQGGPLCLREQRGKAVVLVDFWNYTCINCIRTLPYVAGWYRRYRGDGLIVAGVRAPEFSFARERQNVLAAIESFGLEYPVVLDNDYAIWRAFSNRCWPAKYLVDSQGRIRYYHFGEGRLSGERARAAAGTQGSQCGVQRTGADGTDARHRPFRRALLPRHARALPGLRARPVRQSRRHRTGPPP
jgi:thiol-disulfide isomerase/thioredoxin